MVIRLKRLSDDGVRTLGELYAGEMVFATLERPWLSNPAGAGGIPRQSCVPRGTYQVDHWNSSSFPNTFILTNHALGVYRQPNDVPEGQSWGRSAILIHVGNRVRDVIGCVCIGLDSGMLQGEPAVLRSVPAMRALNAILKRSSHSLVIE